MTWEVYTQVYKLEQLDQVVDVLLTYKAHSSIWMFEGDMGSGKTTLIRNICLRLGSKVSPSSPTFAIIHTYPLVPKGQVHHMDLYRLKNIGEALEIGIEEILLSGDLCLIEWPQILLPILSSSTLQIRIDYVDELSRKITISKNRKGYAV